LKQPKRGINKEENEQKNMAVSQMKNRSSFWLVAALGVTSLSLAGCSGDSSAFRRGPHSAQACMERAIYFESNRSSREGMIAVGTVVMNRVESNKFPNSVCKVVGQKGQFAPGVMTRRMPSKSLPEVQEAARAVLRGERHPQVRNALFFHTYGHRFNYDNMHYVLVAGGNAFYEKRKSHLVTQPNPPAPSESGYLR